MRFIIGHLLAFAMLGVVAPATAATVTLLDGMEDTNYVTANSGTDSLAIANVSGGSEGTNALQLTYTYATEAAWWKNSAIIKTFAAPVDLRAVELFKLDMDVPTPDANFMMVIQLQDELGYITRLLNYGFGTATTGWETKTFKASAMQKSRWLVNGRPANLAKITKVSFHIQNGGDVTAGVFSFKLDNFRMLSGDGLLNEQVLEDFEYVDDAALQAKWASAFQPTTRVLDSSAPYAGGKSLAMTATINGQWTNSGAELVFDTARDLSAASYFKIAIAGDTDLATYNPTAHLFLVDEDGRRIQSFVWGWPAVAGWHEMYLPFQGDGIEGLDGTGALLMGGDSAWRQDKWDGRGTNYSDDCETTRIKKLILAIEVQGTGTFPINDVQIKVDNIIAGYTTASEPGPEVPSVKNYTVNKISSAFAPVVNGAVGSGEWDLASAASSGFVHHDNNTLAATEDPQIRAVYDDDALYLLYQVVNQNFSLDFSPTGGGRDPVGTGFAGDDFEFFIAPRGNMADEYYQTVFFPNQADNIAYVWDAFTGGAPAGWNATGDQAAFSYDNTSKLLTIEYRIPFTAFSAPTALVNAAPVNGVKWGVQIGYINNNPVEFVNWEPDATAGFAPGRPFGTFLFSATPTANARDWHLFE